MLKETRARTEQHTHTYIRLSRISGLCNKNRSKVGAISNMDNIIIKCVRYAWTNYSWPTKFCFKKKSSITKRLAVVFHERSREVSISFARLTVLIRKLCFCKTLGNYPRTIRNLLVFYNVSFLSIRH